MTPNLLPNIADPVQDTLAKAGNELARGSNVTASIQGNPLESFAPKKLEVPRLPSYSMARHARRGGIVSGV